MYDILSVIVNITVIVTSLSFSLEMLIDQAHYSTINVDKKKVN